MLLGGAFDIEAYRVFPRAFWLAVFKDENMQEYLADATTKRCLASMKKLCLMSANPDSLANGKDQAPQRKKPTNVEGHLRYAGEFKIEQVAVLIGKDRPQCFENVTLEQFKEVGGTCAFDIGRVNKDWENEFRKRNKNEGEEIPQADYDKFICLCTMLVSVHLYAEWLLLVMEALVELILEYRLTKWSLYMPFTLSTPNRCTYPKEFK